MTAHTLSLKCKCGAIEGTAELITPKTAGRLVCYCIDCQTYAYALERPDVLDERGGTEVLQVSPAQVKFTQGEDKLACMRLSPKGPLRWYCSSCHTPVGNALDKPGMPFLGLIHSIIDDPDAHAKTGPILGKVNASKARGGCPEDAHPGMPKGVLFKSAMMLARHKLAGRAKPSPIRNADGSLVAEPRILTKEERIQFRERASGATG
ncbi:MAG: DUF6151 family protein [Bradymonadia bacterium]